MKKDKRKFSFGGHWTTGSEAGGVKIPVGESEEEMRKKADKASKLFSEMWEKTQVTETQKEVRKIAEIVLEKKRGNPYKAVILPAKVYDRMKQLYRENTGSDLDENNQEAVIAGMTILTDSETLVLDEKDFNGVV